jgi:hypothetical protein
MAKEINLNANRQPGLNINPNDLEDMVCSKCECQTFEPVFLFKKLSAVMSPTGKETLIPLQVYRCTECGHIEEGFLPKDQPNG